MTLVGRMGRCVSNRPPSEVSPFTTTYLAVRALQRFGTEKQKSRIDERVKKAATWLSKTAPKDTEDHVFRLWGMRRVGADKQEMFAAELELIDRQRPDGGWAQNDDLQSDAYATGTVLTALNQNSYAMSLACARLPTTIINDTSRSRAAQAAGLLQRLSDVSRHASREMRAVRPMRACS